eukprot:g11852.t1
MKPKSLTTTMEGYDTTPLVVSRKLSSYAMCIRFGWDLTPWRLYTATYIRLHYHAQLRSLREISTPRLEPLDFIYYTSLLGSASSRHKQAINARYSDATGN